MRSKVHASSTMVVVNWLLKSHSSYSHLHDPTLPPSDFLFLPKSSATTIEPQQALRLVEHISEGFKRKRKTVAVFFDVAKAFDKVWHASQIYKLHQQQVPDRLVFIIQHYLTNRQFSFRHEKSTSAKRLIRAGVPQGSTLSPLLYSAYTNDIPRPQTGVQLALFADDTALYLSGSNFRIITPRLQKAVDELTRWFQTWRIEVNPEKSAVIFFNYSSIKKKEVIPYNSPTFRINKPPIPWHHKYKYLGITLDKHLHFKDHIKRVRQNAQLYLSRLSGMISKKSKMSLRNKCTLYKVCIRPVMTDAELVFGHADPKALYQLQILQNNFCRRASGAPWYVRNDTLHRDLELLTISKYMQDMSKKFFDTAANHPNPLLQSAVSYEPPPSHHFIRRPRNVLSDPPDELIAEVERAIRRRRHPMPIGRDRRNPQNSNLLGLRTTANQQAASGVFWSVKIGHPTHAGAWIVY
ncbi:RNA-directed DNA polymerase from mobile element jockey [Eumeta japonica]|uniref:RNA-directed DNA polymerase from mobile element jockey n=1 Tax=Eumeta variegata TaxID=151549 RepID=A0A4C1SS90_EUMVA|nr:RNA-directed DNA polymerase from mobile element jockey [Eumeta japonica]